ncbi:MAG TPA: glycosyltransferase family 39 protein, partial [Chloroflexota bacterium]|nr:glycosyltransferase family 39 protein [Chloroflexota bacterium]
MNDYGSHAKTSLEAPLAGDADRVGVLPERAPSVEPQGPQRERLRHWLNWHDRRWQILSCTLLATTFAISAATIRGYGITWDEEHHKEYGVILLNWYMSLGHDTEALSKWNLYYYGGFADTLAQLFAQHVPFGVYEARHIVCLLFGLVGIAATYGLGHRIAGPRGGFFSALFLTLTPVYYGHMFNNPKDIPFAAMFTLALLTMLLAFDSLPRVPKRRILLTGIVTGLAMGIRVNGVVLLALQALLWGGWLLGRCWCNPFSISRSIGHLAIDLGKRFVVVVLVAWSVMLVTWPWALVSPILHPLEALLRTTDYDWPLTVFFDGRFIKASELPSSYLPTWFAISMPEFYFAALQVGIILTAAFLRGFTPTMEHINRLLKTGLLVGVFLVPILAATILKA